MPICRLLISLLAYTSKEGTLVLHPRLAAIDKEIQGTSLLHAEDVQSGQRLVRVLYWGIMIGHLRILSREIPNKILRQAWGDNTMSPEIALSKKDIRSPEEEDQKIPLQMLNRLFDNCCYYHSVVGSRQARQIG